MKQISEMTRDEVNRELCERTGLCWHANHYEWRDCDKAHVGDWRIDFYSDSGKVQLLREMRKLKHFWYYYDFLCDIVGKIGVEVILDCLENQDGLLAITALEFLRKEQG